MEFVHKQREERLRFIENISDGGNQIEGAIIKIAPGKGYNNYVTAFGDPLKEDTLVIGDTEDNIIVCFKGGDGVVTKRQVLEGVSVIPHFDYTTQCIIHKKEKLADVPQYLINVIFQNNITNNINVTIPHSAAGYSSNELSNKASGRLAEDLSKRLQLGASDAEAFMSRFYHRGGMMDWKIASSNSEWMKEYESQLIIKKVNKCKTCGNKAIRGCCGDYSAKHRVIKKQIIGWSEIKNT